jgi:hypothetical protein
MPQPANHTWLDNATVELASHDELSCTLSIMQFARTNTAAEQVGKSMLNSLGTWILNPVNVTRLKFKVINHN